MNTLVLSPDTASLSIKHLLKRASHGGVELRDTEGNIVAFVLSPSDREAWIYAEANLDIDQHIDEVREALSRRGGVTTTQLLEKAIAAAEESSPK
jgi:hypothetical protein